MSSAVTFCTSTYRASLARLLAAYGMQLALVARGTAIPGSYWGDSEAGLVADTLYVREDTPLHSALHEACHYICMDELRRTGLHTDAGGDNSEENAVCYLQAILADRIADYDRDTLFADMDRWGYSFRLGSASAWFADDADDAYDWLLRHRLIDTGMNATGLLRR